MAVPDLPQPFCSPIVRTDFLALIVLDRPSQLRRAHVMVILERLLQVNFHQLILPPQVALGRHEDQSVHHAIQRQVTLQQRTERVVHRVRRVPVVAIRVQYDRAPQMGRRVAVFSESKESNSLGKVGRSAVDVNGNVRRCRLRKGVLRVVKSLGEVGRTTIPALCQKLVSNMAWSSTMSRKPPACCCIRLPFILSH